MGLDLVAVYRAKNELMANTIRDLLLQDGIGATLQAFRIMNDPENARTNVYGNSFGAWGEVIVNREHANAAIELIQGFLDASDTPLSDEELESLALAAGDPEVHPWVTPSTTKAGGKPKGALAVWLRKAQRLFWTVAAGPLPDQKP